MSSDVYLLEVEHLSKKFANSEPLKDISLAKRVSIQLQFVKEK